jgi:hypothetical protein
MKCGPLNVDRHLRLCSWNGCGVTFRNRERDIDVQEFFLGKAGSHLNVMKKKSKVRTFLGQMESL